MTTTNQCYKALSSEATAMMTCKKRKSKITELVPLEIMRFYFLERILRSITDQAVVKEDSPIFPTPSSKDKEPKKPNSAELAASYADARAARFVYYWATFTETSTSFSYTATSSIASLFCTPPGYTVVPCPLSMVGKKK